MTGYRAYPAYKDSGVEWQQRIPDHWHTKPLFGLGIESRLKNTGMQESNVLSLSYGKIKKRRLGENEGLLPESYETYQIVNPGFIVLRLTDLQNDKRSLRSALVEQRGIITSAYLAFSPGKQCSPEYVAYLMRAYDLAKVFYSMGGGLRQSLKFEEMRRMPMIHPPLPEQKTIAAFLDRETARIDALIDKKQRLIELLKEKRQALITRAVTRGLDPDVPLKDSGVEWLGAVPGHWDVVKLRWISDMQNGIAKGKNYGDRTVAMVPYLRVANVQDGYLDLTEVKEIAVLPEEIARYSLQKGDVLMNEGGDFDKLGRGTVWDGSVEPCLHQNHVFAVRPHVGLSSEWLAAFTASISSKFHFMSRANQSTNLASISSSAVKDCHIAFPPLKEQRTTLSQIGERTDQLDKLSRKTQRVIELLKERRAALITAAVTGQIDLRDEPTAEAA